MRAMGVPGSTPGTYSQSSSSSVALNAGVAITFAAIAVSGAGLHAIGVGAAGRIETPFDADGVVGAGVGVTAAYRAIPARLCEVAEPIGIDGALRAGGAIVPNFGRAASREGEEDPQRKPGKTHHGGE